MDQIPIKYIVVDDCELDRELLGLMLKSYINLQNVGVFEHPVEALSAIKAVLPDLVFLDIEMPDISGIDLLKTIRDIVPMAVFITSYSEFAIEGFELSALDYVLKPLTEERLKQTLNRVNEYWEMKKKSDEYDILIERDMLTIKQGHDKLKLPLSEVIYLEALNDYTKFYTKKKSYITLGSLSHILNQMPSEIFFRIHRSYAVAGKKITALRKNEIHCEEVVLPVGKTYKSALENYNLF